MKRQKSVSIFFAIIVILLAWAYIKFSNETRPKENIISTENNIQKEESVTISNDYISYSYYIKHQHGRLVVYKSPSHEIFMETSIEIYSLPSEIQEKINTGIFFQTEQELYDFLESYSS